MALLKSSGTVGSWRAWRLGKSLALSDARGLSMKLCSCGRRVAVLSKRVAVTSTRCSRRGGFPIGFVGGGRRRRCNCRWRLLRS